jgi:cell wall-associated NlpC family hydrolase
MTDIRKLIGIPFIRHGRTFDGCDCYGLVRLALAEVYDIFLPLLAVAYDTQEDEERMVNNNVATVGGVEVFAPEEAAIVVLRYHGKNSHVGLCLGVNEVLHTEPFKDSHVDRLNSSALQSRIVRYYRVR